MARTGARSVCLSVASVPFFGGGGLLGRSCGMRQSRPGCCARSWCAARRAWLAVAPSNAMRAACDELAVPLLIVAMKTYRKHVLGRAMIPRLCCMGGRQRLHSNQAASNFASLAPCRGPPAVCRSLCEGFCRRVRQQSFARVCRMPPSTGGPGPLRNAACLTPSYKGRQRVLVSLANRSLRSLQRKGVEHSFWA